MKNNLENVASIKDEKINNETLKHEAKILSHAEKRHFH